MKKLLSLLGAAVFVGSGASGAVACSNSPSDQIDNQVKADDAKADLANLKLDKIQTTMVSLDKSIKDYTKVDKTILINNFTQCVLNYLKFDVPGVSSNDLLVTIDKSTDVININTDVQFTVAANTDSQIIQGTKKVTLNWSTSGYVNPFDLTTLGNLVPDVADRYLQYIHSLGDQGPKANFFSLKTVKDAIDGNAYGFIPSFLQSILDASLINHDIHLTSVDYTIAYKNADGSKDLKDTDPLNLSTSAYDVVFTPASDLGKQLFQGVLNMKVPPRQYTIERLDETAVNTKVTADTSLKAVDMAKWTDTQVKVAKICNDVLLAGADSRADLVTSAGTALTSGIEISLLDKDKKPITTGTVDMTKDQYYISINISDTYKGGFFLTNDSTIVPMNGLK